MHILLEILDVLENVCRGFYIGGLGDVFRDTNQIGGIPGHFIDGKLPPEVVGDGSGARTEVNSGKYMSFKIEVKS